MRNKKGKIVQKEKRTKKKKRRPKRAAVMVPGARWQEVRERDEKAEGGLRVRSIGKKKEGLPKKKGRGPRN